MNITPIFAEVQTESNLPFSNAHFNVTIRKSKNGAIISFNGSIGNEEYTLEKQTGETDVEMAVRAKTIIVGAIEAV